MRHPERLRYEVFRGGERIATSALLEDSVHIVRRYAADSEHRGVHLYVRDTYRWDLPVVYETLGGCDVRPDNVVPLRPQT